MTSSQNGWVRFYRQSLDSSVFENPIMWKVWSWCLLRACHKKQEFPFNGGDIELAPGQFITGRDKACQELSLTPQRYRTAINYLKSTSRITIKTTNKYSIITVNKWNDYQIDNQQTNQPLTNKQPTTNQQITTYKNDKKDKKEEVAATYSQRVQYVADCLGEDFKITPRVIKAIDVDYKDYLIKNTIDKMAAHYIDDLGKIPNTMSLINWLINAEKFGELERREK
jgi:hypothetical protein